jgi:hypothetical protein
MRRGTSNGLVMIAIRARRLVMIVNFSCPNSFELDMSSPVMTLCKWHASIHSLCWQLATTGIVLYLTLFSPCFHHLQMNIGGASDRPVPRDIWTVVQAKLANPSDDSIPQTRIRNRGACSLCNIL